MEFQTVKGMRDLLPDEFNVFKQVIREVRQLFENYNYQEISMPIVEPFELLAAKSGPEIKDTMYVFEDKAGRLLALRPEMTASIARVYINNFMLAAKKPVRLSYIGSCYRYDNPQYGRYREFQQAGFEIIGSEHPEADAEILTICADLMTRLGITDFNLKVGHVGILRNLLEQEGLGETIQNQVFSLIDRDRIDDAYQLLKTQGLKDSCITTIKKLRELKGKDAHAIIERAPALLNTYPTAKEAVQNLKEILTLYVSSGGIHQIMLDLGFARGLEYYTGMIFEIFIPGISIAVGGGGRYDKLIETFHGQSTPAVGCAPGIDRLVLAMTEKGLVKNTQQNYHPKVIILCIDDQMLPESLKIAHTLRSHNIPAEFEIGRKKLKKALAYAVDKKVQYSIIIGSDEIIKGLLTVKDLATEEQHQVPMDDIVPYFKEKIKGIKD
ncbi:MAG: histidine--tRNA ligase [Promethearchaeota archaeon]|nr:MAG: histidine--tRNA ligase [Candidatus Lokiarchaeota archaeon]